MAVSEALSSFIDVTSSLSAKCAYIYQAGYSWQAQQD